MNAYPDLEALFRRNAALNHASSILGWDNATMMPEGSGDTRAEQLSVLAELSHEMITHSKMPDLFAEAESEDAHLDDWQRANLREMKRLWQHENCVPVALVSALTRASIESEMAWRDARKNNDFATFLPYQEHVLNIVRDIAQAKSQAMNLSPYDALLDQYDPGMRSADIDVLFADLGEFLPDFIQKARALQARQPKPLPLEGFFPAEQQKALGVRFMQQLGFDFNRGRLDESAHPFCGGVPGDVRLTSRYDTGDLLSGFYSVMHETGHALYEMHLPKEWRAQPVGEARGMSVHESQSLLTEKQLCRSLDFLTYAAPILRENFGLSGQAWEADNLYHKVTRVTPSLIRVDADEATYPAHVILRYRLEKKMIAGELEVKDLPEAWNAGMKELLGVTPADYPDHCYSWGCMQDIHWPSGSFGYFPTYTLGAMIAAQLMATIRSAIPDLSDQIRAGDFAPLYGWLERNVHAMGSKLSTPDLLVAATGRKLDSSFYKRHLEERYL